MRISVHDVPGIAAWQTFAAAPHKKKTAPPVKMGPFQMSWTLDPVVSPRVWRRGCVLSGFEGGLNSYPLQRCEGFLQCRLIGVVGQTLYRRRHGAIIVAVAT